MIVVDTSVWIEFLKGRNAYIEPMRNLLEQGKVMALECIFAELLCGARSSKETKIIYDYWIYLPKIEAENMLLEAGEYAAKHKLLSAGVGFIDAMIVCFSRKNRTQIWSLDKKLLKTLASTEIYHPL